MIDIATAAEIAGGTITAVGGAYSLIRHMFYAAKSKKEQYKQDILKEAKEELSKVELSLNERIKSLEIELDNHKDNISKDLEHMREVYNAEIKVLGSKIDDLRQDLQAQHSSMVALLTKLVNSR